MGGTQTVDQARKYAQSFTSSCWEETETTARVQENVTKTLTQVLISRSVSTTQVTKIDQEVDIQMVEPSGGCPFWSPPQQFDISLTGNAQGQVAVALETLNATDVAQSIKQALEDQVTSDQNITKRGTLAFTDNTLVAQRFQLKDTTVRAIETVMSSELTNRTTQVNEFGQRVRSRQYIMPCGKATITIESSSKMLAADMAKHVTDAILQTEDASSFSTSSDAKNTQSATDTLVAGMEEMAGP